jgi:hypothetical protein
MSKSIKRILIAGIVIAASALLLVVFKYIFPEPVDDTQIDVSPMPTEAPVYYIIKDEGDNVTGMKCTYSDNSTFMIDITSNGDGTFSYAAAPKDAFFDYNTSKFRSMMYTMTSLTATALVEKEPENLSIYGLDKPQFTMEISFKSGDKTTLYVGNETPIAGNYYVITDKDNTVYTIGNYLSSLVMRKPIMYRNIEIFPTYEDEDIYTSINYVGIVKRDGTVIDLNLDSEFKMEGNKASSAYMITSPVRTSCADDQVQTKIMDVVATVKFSSILCDIKEDQFKDYGFDKPARLKMRDTSDNSLDIVIGSTSGDSCYAALGAQYDAYVAGEIDYLTVLTYTGTSFDYLDINYMSLLNRAIWLIDIHDVASVVYDMDGKVYDMQLSEYNDVTGSGVDVVRVVSKMNSKDINEDNTKRIYSRTLNFRVVGTLAEGIEYAEDYTYSITVNLRDGSSHVMTMNKINDRQFACIIDGVATYYVYLSNIENLTTALDRAMDDREVSLVYNT